MATLRSPNEFVRAASAMYLNGRRPRTYNDWVLVLNFVAWNVEYELEESILALMTMLYDMPVTSEEAREIAIFQMQKKEEEAGFAINLGQEVFRNTKDPELGKLIKKATSRFKPRKGKRR